MAERKSYSEIRKEAEVAQKMGTKPRPASIMTLRRPKVLDKNGKVLKPKLINRWIDPRWKININGQHLRNWCALTQEEIREINIMTSRRQAHDFDARNGRSGSMLRVDLATGEVTLTEGEPAPAG